MRPLRAGLVAFALVVSACGGDDGSFDAVTDPGSSGSASSNTSGIDVCSLLTPDELTSTVGQAPSVRATEPAGPFTGCSWGTGFLIVQIAESDSLILAPGEDACPSAGIGDESVVCNGRVQFLTNGIFTTISTIDRVPEAELTEVARVLVPKLQG
jgi:hypothetical protein